MKNSIIIQDVTTEDLKEIISAVIDESLNRLKTKKQDSPEYLTRQATANLLHISLPTLSDYTRKGLIKGFRIGSRVLFNREHIEECLKEIQTIKHRRA